MTYQNPYSTGGFQPSYNAGQSYGANDGVGNGGQPSPQQWQPQQPINPQPRPKHQLFGFILAGIALVQVLTNFMDWLTMKATMKESFLGGLISINADVNGWGRTRLTGIVGMTQYEPVILVMSFVALAMLVGAAALFFANKYLKVAAGLVVLASVVGLLLLALVAFAFNSEDIIGSDEDLDIEPTMAFGFYLSLVFYLAVLAFSVWLFVKNKDVLRGAGAPGVVYQHGAQSYGQNSYGLQSYALNADGQQGYGQQG